MSISLILFGGNEPTTPDLYEKVKELLPKRLEGDILEQTEILKTEPEEDLDQEDFWNCLFVVKTTLSPFHLLKTLQDIEMELGRVRDVSRPKGPRCIDLDILFYDDLQISTQDLTIPHPGVKNRKFVKTLMGHLSSSSLSMIGVLA